VPPVPVPFTTVVLASDVLGGLVLQCGVCLFEPRDVHTEVLHCSVVSFQAVVGILGSVIIAGCGVL
jgi:hypothetical protein